MCNDCALFAQNFSDCCCDAQKFPEQPCFPTQAFLAAHLPAVRMMQKSRPAAAPGGS
jgi:hypothetical protein